MDKIKTVKIKNPDGSVSEETYAISVDALNVDMANNKNLQETIGTINIDTDGNIAYQLNNLKNNKVNKTDIIDNLNSSSNTKVLSAKQGKVLGDAVAALDTDIKKKAYFFDTVAAMKVANLKDGDYVCTLGYYEPNDGGNGEYVIKSSSTDIYETLNNELVAELLIKEPLNVRTIGLNDNDDCSTKLQSIIDLGITNLYFPKGTYHFSTGIITNKIYWNLEDNAELIATEDMSCLISINKNSTARDKNMYIKGGIINGNKHADTCLGLNNSQYFRFEDIFITNFSSNGIEFDEDSYAGDSGGTFVKNCVFWGISNNATEIGIDLKTNSDCHIIDCIFKDCKTALYIRGGDIKVVGCHAWCNTETKYIGSKFADITGAGRVSFDHCVLDTMQYGVYGGNTIIFTSLINTVFINRSTYGENNIPFIVYSETSYNNYSGININGLLIAANSGKVKIISDSLLNRSDLVQYQSYSGLADYPPESHVEVLNNPGNTCSFSYKTSSASVLNKSSNFDNLTLSFYQLNMFTGAETGTNIPGTDFTGILYNIVNNTTNNYKNNGFQIVFTSTGKLITRYKKGNSWTSWNTFSKDV